MTLKLERVARQYDLDQTIFLELEDAGDEWYFNAADDRSKLVASGEKKVIGVYRLVGVELVEGVESQTVKVLA